MTWDANIYHQFSLDFDMRWDNFFAPRDPSKEDDLYNLLGCDLGKYAFIHEDKSRGFNIKRKYVDSKLNVIKSNPNLKQFSIFDYRKVLENASEIHCIEGSFSALVESINLNSGLYAHRYARPEALRDPWHEYKYRCEWQIITELN